jgi:hypothetical protein
MVTRSSTVRYAPTNGISVLPNSSRLQLSRPASIANKPGTVPTDAEQATGLERLEVLGKMQGIDIFDMRPLDASRLGTLQTHHLRML